MPIAYLIEIAGDMWDQSKVTNKYTPGHHNIL